VKTLLIDADSLLYKAGFSTEYKIRTLEKEGDIIETKSVREMKSLMEAGYALVSSVDILEPVENALHILKNAMEGMVEDCGCQNIRVFLSAPGPTFRKEIYPMYKANRTAPKPKHYYDMYSYLARIYSAEDKPGFEADDLVCIAAYELLYCTDIPSKVSINEAVDVGKKYGSEESRAFINGIIDSVRMAIDRGEICAETEPGPNLNS